MPKKVALFFGSFNPIHIGHTAIASYILNSSEMDELWFVVSPQNPLKEKAILIDSRSRLELTRRALGDHPKMRVSDIEFQLPQPNYTVYTLAILSEKFPDYQFGIILGADNLVHFHKWKNYKAILENFKIWCYPRPGFQIPEDYLNHPAINIIEAPLMEVSSTMIRNFIKTKKDYRFFVRDSVFQMIDEEGLYI